MSRAARLAAVCLLVLPVLGLHPTAGAVGFGRNVEWVGMVPLNNGSAGARRLGNYFYLTTSNGLRIFDITDPLNPRRVGVLDGMEVSVPGQEDVDTNGRILLVGDRMIDVTDKTNPRVIATHSVSSHTITCVLDCTWAYGSEGQIVDLRDPAKPRVSSRRWTQGTPVENSHDVTEIAPGLVVTSSDPVVFLDARLDPERPVVIGKGPKRAQLVTMDATKGWPTYDEDGNLVSLGTF